MSELKSRKFFEVVPTSKAGFYQPGAFADGYLKSEADKVIEELKADYKEACDRLQTANLIKDEQLAATRHQKYKRCLAMAMWCRSRSCFYDTMRADSSFWARKSDRAYKWHKRWLELAEQFKEGK